MTMIRKSRAEIINMVEARYQNPGNRSFDTARHMARYSYRDKLCPLGMCMIDPAKIPEKLNGLHVVQLVCNLNRSAGCSIRQTRHEPSPELDLLLKPEYRGHPVAFWEDLQLLHDAATHFDEHGYSARGRRFLSRLRHIWAPVTQAEGTLRLPRKEANIRFKRP